MPTPPGPPEAIPPREVRERFRGFFDLAEGGHGLAAAIQGTPESGKSRLVADLAHDGRERIWTVLMGTANPRSPQIPRGVLLDALRPALGGIAPAERPLQERSAPPSPTDLPISLMSLLPPVPSPRLGARPSEPPGPAVPWELPPSLSPAEGDALLLRRLWEEAKRGPVLLLVDDAQWVDELSLGLLSTVAREVTTRRILLVLSFDPALAPALTRRFSARDRGGLCDEVFTVAHEAHGTPRSLPPPAPASPEPAEPSLLESLLSLGAVAGLEFEARVLAQATGHPLAEVVENLEEGTRRGWLWRSGEEVYHFSGERTWNWALGLPYEGLPARHARVAQALSQLYPEPSGATSVELADHWQEAGEPLRALPYLIRAAEFAFRVGAYETARERLLGALGTARALPPHQRGPEEVRVLVDLAEVQDALGQGSAAGVRLREAAARASQLRLPARDQVRIEVLLSDMERRQGHGGAAMEILGRARTHAREARDPVAEATVLSRIAMVKRRQGRWKEAREDVELSLKLLGSGRSGPEERALVHFAAADTYVWGGPEDDEPARQNVRLTREAMAELGREHREAALTNLEGLHASQRGDVAESVRLWAKAAETAARMGNLLDAANMLGNLAETQAESRHIEESRACLARAQEFLQDLSEPRIRGQLHLATATLAWVEKDLPRAETEMDAGVKVLASDASVDLRQQIEFLRARIRLSEGRLPEARRILEGLDPHRYPHLLPPVQRTEWETIMRDGSGGPSPPAT